MDCQHLTRFNFLRANFCTDSDEPTFGSVTWKSFLIISVYETQCPFYGITEKSGFIL